MVITFPSFDPFDPAYWPVERDFGRICPPTQRTGPLNGTSAESILRALDKPKLGDDLLFGPTCSVNWLIVIPTTNNP